MLTDISVLHPAVKSVRTTVSSQPPESCKQRERDDTSDKTSHLQKKQKKTPQRAICVSEQTKQPHLYFAISDSDILNLHFSLRESVALLKEEKLNPAESRWTSVFTQQTLNISIQKVTN